MSGHPVHHHHRHHHHHPNSSQAFSPYPPPPPPPQNQTSNSNTTVTTTSNPNHLHHSNHRSSIPTSQPSSSAPLPTPPPPPPPSSSNTSSLRHGSLQISLPPPPPPPPTSSSSISTHHHHHHHSSQQSSHPSNHQQQHQPTSTHQSNSLNQSSNPSYLHPQHSSHQSHSNLQSNLHHPQSHLHHHPSHSRDHHQPIREFHSLHPSHSHSNLGSQRDQRIDHSNHHHHHHHHHHRDRESQREPIQTRSHHPYISLSSQSEPLNRDQQHQITNRESHSHPPPQSSQPTLPHHHPSHSHNHSSSISNHHPTSHSSSAHHHHHHPNHHHHSHPPPPTSPSGHHSPHAPLQSASHTHPSAAVLNLPSQSQPLTHHGVPSGVITNGSSVGPPPSHLPLRSTSSQAIMPPTLPVNGNNGGSSGRQLAQPPPQSIGANGTPPDEDASVAAILRDGELNLQEQAADWRPPTNPSIKELVQELESGLITAGGACETLGEYNRAVDCYERALKLNPLNGTALTKAAGIYRHQENFKTAAKYFSRLLKMHEGNGEIWGALGHCYLMIDELPRTYTSYQQALHHCPSPKSEPKLWYGIGVLYDRYGSLEHAEEAFSSVIKMDPYFEKANEIYFRLGIIYKQQRKADLSLQCFQWILDKPPSPLTEIDIWFQIGHVHEQQGNFDRAKEAYERVLTENPTHAKVLQQLGGLYCREGASFYDPHEAIVILNRSRSVDSNDPFTWYLLGRVHMIIQDYHRAYESYQQAVYREGKNPAFWCSIGVLYYAISQFLDSLDAYSRAIRINPFLSEVWFNLGALYESCKDQMPDAIDAYTRAIQLDSNNAHIHRRLEEIKLHQETGAPLSAPPSPKDMSYTSANWPFPNALNGPSDVGFGHTSAQPHDESNRAPIIHSPNSPLNNLHTSSAGPLSPVGSSGRNIIRPDTSNSAIGMRPQSAGSFTHAPSSSLPHGNRHQPSHSGHPAPPPSHYAPSSSLTRRQSGGHGPLAPMEFEPSPRLPNRGHPSASQHNLPHIHAVVDSHSRGSSPTPTAPESVRRSQALPVSAPREIVSPHTSPSIRPNVAPNDRMHYCGQSIGPPGAISHLGPSSAYSRYPPSNPSMEDTIPSQSQHPGQLGGLLNRERVRDRPGRESARFRPHSPDSRAGRADRDARIPPTTNPSNNAHSHRSGDYGGAGFPVPPQAQRQLPYDNRQGSPGLRGPPTGPRPFSPENAHTPPWPGIDSRTGLQNPPSGGAGGVVSPELRRSGSRSSQSFPPGSNLPPSHQIPPPQHGPPSGRYDPRYDDSMIPGHRKSISAEQVSPQRPRSALQRSHEEIERQKALTVARQAQPSPTPSVAASEFSISGGNGANPSRRSARSKGISKEDEYPSGPAIRKRKAPASRLNVNNSNAVVPPVPSVNNSTSVSSIVAPVTSPSATAMNEGTQTQPISRDKKEKKKMANTKVRGVIKSKINDNSKGPSPSPAPPALSTELAPNQISQPTPGSGTSLPDRKVDEAFEEYDEVADTLLSFATQPSCRVLPSQQSSQDLSSHSAPPISKGSRVGISGSSKTGGSSRNGRNGNSAVSPESEKSSGGGAGGSRSGRSPSNSSHSMPARSIRGSPKRADSSPESTLTQPYLNQSSHYLQHSGNSISSNSIAVSPSVENHTGIVALPPGLLTSGGSQFIASSYTASSAPVPKRLRSDGSSPSGWESGHDVKRSRASGQLSPLSVTNGETRSPHSTGGVSNIHGKTNMMSITGGRKGIMNDGYKKAREHRGNGSEQHQSSRRGKKGSDRPNPQRTVNEEEEDNKSAYDEGEEEFSKNRPSMDEDEGEEEEEAEDEVEEEEDEERDGQDVEMSTAT